MKKKNIIIQLLVVAGIVLVVNLISNKLYFRLDFTEDNRYTLSEATENILKELEGVITVKAYFSEDLPPQLLKNRQDFQDQLIEYENTSGGKIVYEFINPNESEELEREAQQQGISPVMINVTERDQVQQMRAYMGAVMKMNDRTEVIPMVRPGAAMEYALTTAIKKISITDKPKLGLIQGFGEAGMQAIPQLLQQLSVLYDVEAFNLKDTSKVPSYYRSLIWLNPQDSIAEEQFAKLNAYLDQGGGLFISYSNVKGNMQQGLLSATPAIGLERWIAEKGINIEGNFVIDANCASVSVQQRTGFFTINSQVEFPYFPIAADFGESPVTQGLETVIFQFVSSLEFNNADTTVAQIPLVYSSQNSGLVTPPTYVDIQKKWGQSDFMAGQQLLAGALDGIGKNREGKLVFVANGSFCVNGEGQRAQQVNPDNINLASNAIDWISDDTGLIDLRTEGITSRPLEQVEESTKSWLKYGNVLAPVILILIYAFVRSQRNARKRQRWMQGNYQ